MLRGEKVELGSGNNIGYRPDLCMYKSFSDVISFIRL